MTAVVVMIGLVLHAFGGGVLTDELAVQVGNASPDQKTSCIVFMNSTYPYHEVEQYTVHEKIELFRSIAQTSQQNVITWLSAVPNEAVLQGQYWVGNCFCVEATVAVIKELAERDDVAWISHNGEVHAIVEQARVTGIDSRAIEWNIQKIMADSCWTVGFSGQGVIIGMCDTGVDYEHPALAGKWSGYWLDVINGQPLPYDDMTGTWHGTHCMGTILGGDGFGSFTEDIGVAPDAQYAAAKMLNSGGSGTYQQCLEGLQFMADLKDSVDIKAVSNSWGGSNGADTFFYPIMRTYIAIGILPIFANGNNGTAPACPGSYSNNIGVGATDSNDDIASFSNPGPAPDIPPFNDPSTWLRDDWNLIKPQISAPGVNIRSAKGDGSGGYHNLNGTSMATPHVCGAVAIVCQKNQNLTPQMIYSILLDNVDEPSQGSPYPNNTYGWGRLNVWKALNGTPSMAQPWIAVIHKTMDNVGPGETGQLLVTLKNVGGDDAYNTVGTLESFDNFISVSNETFVFGDLAPNDTANNSASPYEFTAHALTPPGHHAKIGLIVHADGDHDTLDFDDTLYYSFTVGTAPAPTVIYEDDFEYGGGIDSFPHYWEVTGNWQRSTAESHSATHSAYSGATLDNATYFTLKNAVNLSSFSDPQLGFWHMYNFDQGIFMDDASVQVSTNGGSSWSTIWEYNWLEGNTLPWTEMTISVPSSNNVKVRYAIDGFTFFQDYTDWYIDDFIFFTPTDNEPPYFTNTTVWPDTNFAGPFPVQSMITDASGVDQARLYYRVNGSSWQNMGMTHQGNSVYLGTIPQQNLDDTIDYYLWARDVWFTPNEGTDPVGAPGDGYYSFQTSIIGVDEEILRYISFTMLSANPTRSNVAFNFAIPRDIGVNVVVYDAAGRAVRTLVRETMKAGDYTITWDRKDDRSRSVAAGIYFMSLCVDEVAEYRIIQKLVVLE